MTSVVIAVGLVAGCTGPAKPRSDQRGQCWYAHRRLATLGCRGAVIGYSTCGHQPPRSTEAQCARWKKLLSPCLDVIETAYYAQPDPAPGHYGLTEVVREVQSGCAGGPDLGLLEPQQLEDLDRLFKYDFMPMGRPRRGPHDPL